MIINLSFKFSNLPWNVLPYEIENKIDMHFFLKFGLIRIKTKRNIIGTIKNFVALKI